MFACTTLFCCFIWFCVFTCILLCLFWFSAIGNVVCLYGVCLFWGLSFVCLVGSLVFVACAGACGFGFCEFVCLWFAMLARWFCDLRDLRFAGLVVGWLLF